MSPIDPQSLRAGSPFTILDDRECVNCGYNLKGIRADGVCPECGRKIAAKRKDVPRYSDSLIHAPKTWLAGLAMGSIMLFLSAIGLLTLVVVAIIFSGRGLLALSVFKLGLGLIWTIGVVLTTQPRPVMPTTQIDPRKEWRGLRWASRLTQLLWIVAPLCTGLYAFQLRQLVTPPEALLWLAAASVLGAMLGLIWFCVYLSNVAFWGDDEVGSRFRTCAWMIGAAAFLATLHVVNSYTQAILMGAFWASLVYALLMFFVVAPEFYLVYCLFQLQHMARWSMTNHSIADAKTRRLRAQAAVNARRGAAPATSKIPEAGPIDVADDSSVNPADAMPAPGPRQGGVEIARSIPRNRSGTPYDTDDH
ncbi:MAG: hypothetical protein AB7G11_14270 [Phycisphaerales bacterium]